MTADTGLLSDSAWNHRLQRLSIGDVEAVEGEAIAVAETGQPPFLQPDIRGISQVVDARNGVACVQ